MQLPHLNNQGEHIALKILVIADDQQAALSGQRHGQQLRRRCDR